MTDTQQPPDIAQQQQQQPQPPAAAAPGAPASSNVGENLACQWQNCGERSPTAESLYEHVCERHVGRKSTNNLNLTCGWGACRTTTVKRDHITSHIRVHVPLKPHKCEFCGKAFKRPQDLKKHVKTHADDSVILRSPEPGSNQRASGVYNVGNEKTPSYYAQAINPGQDHNGGYHGAPNQYYQPQHHQAAQHPAYGPVTYYSNAPATHAALSDYESRKRGFEALDNFFGEVKRRNFDPSSYQNLSHRLFELQGLQLPMITQQPVSAIPAYQPVSAMTGVGGGYGAHEPMQAYSLPPMGNVKTRGDLTSIDQILEQMQQTIYDSDTSIAQAGTGQPGAYVAYRTSHSPPSVHLSSSHLHQNSMMNQGQHQHHGSIASATESVHSSTPALTPPSSAQSYTSGHSPVSHHAMTPIQGSSSGTMYPSLPVSSSGMDYGLNPTSGSGPATLMYDADDHRRRYSGGMLQRAQPAPRSRRSPNDDAMDIESEGSITPPASAKEPKASERKASPKYSVIDPALGGDAAKTPTSESSKGGEMSKEEVERERDWVQNMRLIEWMRDYIKKRLEEGEFEDEGAATSKKDVPEDSEMAGTEQTTKQGQSLYPTLKADV